MPILVVAALSLKANGQSTSLNNRVTNQPQEVRTATADSSEATEAKSKTEKAAGIKPAIIESVVIRIGRNRKRQA
jgi:hypothetical protein